MFGADLINRGSVRIEFTIRWWCPVGKRIQKNGQASRKSLDYLTFLSPNMANVLIRGGRNQGNKIVCGKKTLDSALFFLLTKLRSLREKRINIFINDTIVLYTHTQTHMHKISMSWRRRIISLICVQCFLTVFSRFFFICFFFYKKKWKKTNTISVIIIT